MVGGGGGAAVSTRSRGVGKMEWTVVDLGREERGGEWEAGAGAGAVAGATGDGGWEKARGR